MKKHTTPRLAVGYVPRLVEVVPVVRPLKATHVEVSTTAYQFAHGRLPALGRGVCSRWGFFLGTSDGPLIWAPSNLSYVAAKKYAKEVAARRGFSRIVVAP
jgi:hypothetical protein